MNSLILRIALIFVKAAYFILPILKVLFKGLITLFVISVTILFLMIIF